MYGVWARWLGAGEHRQRVGGGYGEPYEGGLIATCECGRQETVWVADDSDVWQLRGGLGGVVCRWRVPGGGDERVVC